MQTELDIIEWREVEKQSWTRARYFDHTRFICQRRGTEDEFYFGIGKLRYSDLRADPHRIQELQLEKISNEDIFPKWQEGLTIVSNPLPYNVYLKSPKLIDYGESDISARFLHEAQICEIIKANPHPNVAEYHGCVVKDGVIKALCFARYPLNLAQRGNENIPINTDHCFKFVGKGAKHLHSLGLAHNDIQPTNIMMDGDRPILIDFHATRKVGESLRGWKAGGPPWLPVKGDENTSKTYNDSYATQQIYHWLRDR